ncbi:MAG TPA: carboxypeptidase regulatory-like domain-containing protein [Gammaproteobacteria bacterium]|nr:carboxypeptidase regulatory-like domain-containing protein [Gammaproteobacteria bacterium]
MQKTVSLKMPFNGLAAAIVALVGGAAAAEDELSIQVLRDGAPAERISLVLDGSETRVIGSSGMAFFDLGAGQHSIQITEGGNAVHTFRFASTRNQLADVTVDLTNTSAPAVAVETYDVTETAAQLVQAATGTVQGQVTANGAPIAGATVQLIDGLTRSAETDANGRFSIEAPRGRYRLVASRSGFGSQELSDFRVIANVVLASDLELGGAQAVAGAAPMEEVVVVGSALIEGTQQTTERFSVEIVDALDNEQIVRFGDTDIAASVLRVPAVTVQDGKFVFVRGLGDRYISTSLNGASMPSTDPTKRTVPLDLFPSSMIDRLYVGKSFIAPISGESTGGNIRITTRTFPNEANGKFSFGIGYTDGATGEDAWTDPISGDWDFFGIDDGSRERPVVAWAVAEALNAQRAYTDTDVYDESVRRELGRIAGLTLIDGMDIGTTTARPDLSMSVSYGDLHALDDLEADFGYFVAASLKNEWKEKEDGIRRSYGGANASQTLDDYTFSENDNNIDLHGLVVLGFNRNHSSYKSNTILTRSTTQSGQRSDGIDGDELDPAINWSIEWEERQYVSQQFTGSHILGSRDQWSANWQGTVSQATRYAPDRRDVRFIQIGDDDIYDLQSVDLVRRYDDLVDDNLDFSSDVEYYLPGSNVEARLQFGAQAISRERDSDSNSYGFIGGFFDADFNNAPNLSFNDVINDSTITGDISTGFDFSDKTLASDSYEAEMTLNSVYVSYDALFNSKYQFVVGVRREDFEQATDTFSLQGAQTPVRSLVEEASTLPAFNFNWYWSGDQQIRFSASRTVARPDLKETSNATFYDAEFNFRVRGNPNLRVSDVSNYDVRWEKYWSSRESISVALFYKDLDDPIERVVQPASGTAGNSRTFQNANAAEIKGIEIDVRKDFALNAAFTKSLFLAANTSAIDSEVTLIGGETRALQGAPDYSINVILGYDDISNGQEFTILFNQSGDTIVDVGVSGQPDVIQQPRLDVDFNYRYYINEALIFRVKVENLLDSEIEYTQGGRIFQRYKTGQRFQAGVDWSF